VTRLALGAWLVTCAAHAAPLRLMLSIGHDEGQLGDAPLRYAQTDAQRVRDVFVELGGVKAADAELVVGRAAPGVEAALARLASRVEAARAEQREVVVFVYVSSHASAGVLHLGESGLSLAALREAVARMPASLRVLVVDACSSGAIVRQKGGQRATPSVTLGATPTRGTVVISSSGPVEAAQEWEALTSSLFTHHWLAGLRGRADVNLDGRVSLNEAYAYASAQTVATAAQHPAYELELSGSTEVVLTEPRRASSAVELTAALEGRFVVLSDDGAAVFLELEKAAGQPLRLALPAGRFRVRRTTSAGTQLATFALSAQTLKSLSDEDFVRESAWSFASKGGRADPWSFAVEASLSSGPASTVRPTLGPGLWFRWHGAALWLAFGGALGVGVDPGARAESLFALQGAVGARLQVGGLRGGVGLLARPMLLVGDETRAALEVGVVGVVEFVLVGPVFVGASVEGLVRAVPVVQAGSAVGARGALLFGSSF